MNSRNVLLGVITWPELCELSIKLTNVCKDSLLKDDLVWVNEFSGFIPHSWDAGRCSRSFCDRSGDCFLGFADDSRTKSFSWGEHWYGEPELRAKKLEDGTWELQFFGNPRYECEDRESSYLIDFLLYAQPRSIVFKEVRDVDIIEKMVEEHLSSWRVQNSEECTRIRNAVEELRPESDLEKALLEGDIQEEYYSQHAGPRSSQDRY